MDKISDTLNDRESHPIPMEYDNNDINISIQETLRAIEKFAFDGEWERDKLK